MSASRILVGLLCAAVVLSGCQVDTTPRTVSSIAGGKTPSIIHAPWRGVYRLYAIPPGAKDGIEQAGKPIAEVHLAKDQLVGFMRTAQGVVAVAGEQQIPVAQGRYDWMMQADAGQTDPVKTALLVVAVVVVAVGIVAIIIAVDVSQSGLGFGGVLLHK